jgi:hypothetical protein
MFPPFDYELITLEKCCACAHCGDDLFPEWPAVHVVTETDDSVFCIVCVPDLAPPPEDNSPRDDNAEVPF